MKYIYFLIGFFFVIPFVTSAADPSVASFIAGSYSINSGQSASFAWSVADAGGYSFVIPCTLGIKFKKTNGSIFLCDTQVSSVATATDGIDLSVWNLSGTTKSFTARVIPKDASGVDFFNGHQDIQVSVATVADPIESMVGATAASSSVPYTLSWSGGLIDGVNLSISCASTIRTTTSSYQQGDIPCNTFLSTSGLPASGSLVFLFNNSDTAAKNITLTLTPMMAAGIYNGLQTKSITVSVDTNIAPNAVAASFTTSTNLDRVPEGTSIPFSWTTTAATGANIILSCNEHITDILTVGGASSTPKCATLAFATAMPANGTGAIIFLNNDFASESITATLIPARTDGGFDATRGKELTFRILPKGVPVVVPVATRAPVQTTITKAVTTTAATVTTPVVTKKIFTKNLARGSSGVEVRALQEFLKKDHAIYPEGTVNGTFGPATERAVKRFQTQYNIGNTRTPGYGGVGPKTRELLNSLSK